jgi:hypothetical protein
MELEPRLQPAADVDALIVPAVQPAIQPPPLQQGEALIALQVDFARLEVLVDLEAFAGDAGDLNDEHGARCSKEVIFPDSP